MRPRIASLLLLALVGSVAVAAPRHSRSSLRSSLNHVYDRIRGVRSDLHATKVHESQTRDYLSTTQQQLEMTRGKLFRARNKLFTTRNQIRSVRKELVTTQRRLKVQSTAMRKRILAAYMSPEPTPLAVVLSATSYADLTNRARFAGMIATQDQRMLVHLVNFEHTLQEKQSDLTDLEQQQQQVHNQVQYEAAQVANQEGQLKSTLNEIMSNRQQLEEQLSEMDAESSRIQSMLEAMQRRDSSGGYADGYNGKWSGRFLRPVPGGVTSPFGMRYHPILHYYRMHTGVDLHAPYGEAIHAAGKGKVVYANWRGGYGKCVIIDHGSGFATLYGHMSAILVSPGQIVGRGQVIGRVGATGMATGPHLHFEVRINGRPVNPLNYIR